MAFSANEHRLSGCDARSRRDVDLDLQPVFDNQEEDARPTVGTIYWEGAVRTRRADGVAGRGYLELTGYGEPLRL